MDFERDVTAAAEKAVDSYFKMSKAVNLVVPENWLQCKIAEYFFEERTLNVVLEASSNKERWDSQIENPLADHVAARIGRPDLLSFDEATGQKFVIEVKGVRSTWSSFAADAERIREFVQARRVNAGALAYASGLLTESELRKEQEHFQQWTGSKEGVDKLHFDRFPNPYDPSGKYAFQISALVY